jgi:hypothetical protein
MTNATTPDHADTFPADLLALASTPAPRRPVKVVEHPTFRAARARRAMGSSFTVLRVPVVALNRPAGEEGCRRGPSTATLVAA